MRGPWLVNKISYILYCIGYTNTPNQLFLSSFFFVFFLFFLNNQPTFILFANRLYWYNMMAEIEVNSHFLIVFSYAIYMSYHCHLLYNGLMYNVKIPWYSNKQQIKNTQHDVSCPFSLRLVNLDWLQGNVNKRANFTDQIVSPTQYSPNCLTLLLSA